MARYSAAVLDASDWVESSFDQPCPICNGDGGCSTMRDGSFARCVERPSEWPLVVGGWVHRIEVRVEEAVLA